MASQLAARNELVNWQVAPAEHEICNYDEPKIRYRQLVEDFIKPLSTKSLKRKTFCTIVTNVLCADIHSSKEKIDPIDRDIYLPLEVSITKWSLADAKTPISERTLNTKIWMVNPGKPVRGCVNYTSDHQKKHLINFDAEDYEQNVYIEPDSSKVMKEINSFLTPDRIVFSLNLRHVRQDLGSLKWLNQQTDYKTKPINVYSLEDLYVVLVRRLKPDLTATIGQAIAGHRIEYSSNPYDVKLQCIYHQTMAKIADMDCRYCAKGLSQGASNVIVDDVSSFTKLYEADSLRASPEN